MTDEECARRVSAIRAEARARVPEWEPWMTEQEGYAGLGKDWLAKVERQDDPRRQRDLARYRRKVMARYES